MTTKKTNLTDLTAESITIGVGEVEAPQTLAATGDVSIKNGTVILDGASAITATLTNPTITTDDNKQLTFVSKNAVAHIVTVAGGFGNGGSGKVKATFGTVIGNCLKVIAYQGYWYVIGGQGFTLGS